MHDASREVLGSVIKLFPFLISWVRAFLESRRKAAAQVNRRLGRRRASPAEAACPWLRVILVIFMIGLTVLGAAAILVFDVRCNQFAQGVTL